MWKLANKAEVVPRQVLMTVPSAPAVTSPILLQRSAIQASRYAEGTACVTT